MIIAENGNNRNKNERLNALCYKLIDDLTQLMISNIRDIETIEKNFNRLFYLIDKYSADHYSIINYSLDSMAALVNVL